MAVSRKKLVLISAPFILVALFFIHTNNRPWQMVWSDACGESPIGFYQMEIVTFEYVDFNGGMYIISDPMGGLAEFLEFYTGQFDPCADSAVS